MRVFAHRGASAAYAEHTRAAFSHALSVGVDGVETDVHLSADGHLVCWHDATLDRTSSGRGPVRAHRLSELRALDVHTWKNPSLPAGYGRPQEQLVTLDELTAMMIDSGRTVELAVEMKHASSMSGALEDAVLEWLRRWGWDARTCLLAPEGKRSRVSVSVMSFSRDSLRRVASLVPASMLCPLFEADDRDAVQIGTSTRGGAAGLLGPSVQWLFHHGSVLRSWTQAGRIVRMWTVLTDDELNQARTLGVQQVTVNDPEWALQRLS
ncbi:glycerophosphodiester phosphodiesterase [Citricoccus sp. NR2]|uniref:glycerophosphodiester phosphodiesterase n=1 Tax=Citricoccus sp. NR2 TaxID=3004095 RepID=UPI0022DD7F8C|nr:glycerophosphodiester phosphodiesterase family protein [Citricoccus sp. NR2]WBL19598.1 glycerophosphodiester phosphodiesterase family protein [Citricoccus sp. NR2]